MDAQPNPSSFQKASSPPPRLSILREESGLATRRRTRIAVFNLTIPEDRVRWEGVINNPRHTILKDQEHSVKTHILTYVRYVEELSEPTDTVDDLWPR